MSDSQPIHHFKRLPDWFARSDATTTDNSSKRLEPSTCVEAEPFALQVLDESMQPEFRKGCIILVDPTGRATDGSYVLARLTKTSPAIDTVEDTESELEDLLFRQLSQQADGGWLLKPLNEDFRSDQTLACTLNDIIGVVVQRAGVRRRYHKRYDNDV